MRVYEQLECGCLVSCDGGGGYIPFSCKDDKICKFDEWSNEHKIVNGRCTKCQPIMK